MYYMYNLDELLLLLQMKIADHISLILSLNMNISAHSLTLTSLGLQTSWRANFLLGQPLHLQLLLLWLAPLVHTDTPRGSLR